MQIECTNCRKEMNLKPSRISRAKNNFCSTECHDEYRRKIKYQEMSEKVGMDFKSWLIQKYLVEQKPTSEISKVLYGDDKKCKIDNGITLCDTCHKEFHSTYGYGNNTKEQFDELINSRHLLR